MFQHFKWFTPLYLLFLLGCDKKEGLVSTETRELTTLDQKPVPLAVTSAQQFEPPGSTEESSSTPSAPQASFHYDLPEGWTEESPTQFREINFSLREGGEVYFSRVRGGVLDNLNRWLGQFGADKLTPESLGSLERVSLLGKEGYLITAEGDYNPGMGRPVKKGQALVGVIADSGGEIMTVKMITPSAQASTEKSSLKKFIASLRRKEQ